MWSVVWSAWSAWAQHGQQAEPGKICQVKSPINSSSRINPNERTCEKSSVGGLSMVEGLIEHIC